MSFFRALLIAMAASCSNFLFSQELDAIQRARSAQDPGVNAAAYTFSTRTADGYGIGGFMALRVNGDGTYSGALIDTVTGRYYDVSGTMGRGVLRLTFRAEDGSSFSGVSTAISGASLPNSLNGSTVGSSGAWSAADGAFFSNVPGALIFDIPGLACTLCQLYHFCGALPQIPCTACSMVCGKKKK